MKYRPEFPDRFGSVEHGRAFCGDFFPWYNNDHHHSGLAMPTSHDVHYGLIDERIASRNATLEAAYQRHPERLPHGRPQAKRPPNQVWINKPSIDPDVNVPTLSPAH